MSVKVIDNTPLLKAKITRNGSLAINKALQDVLVLSRPKTPKGETNFLRNNTRKQVLGLHGKVGWLVVYAQYQERGRRRDGSRAVRRYSTGGTGKGFARNAVMQVTKDRKKYLKGLLK